MGFVKSKLLPDVINYSIFSDMKQNLNNKTEQEDDFPWKETLVAIVIIIVLLILAWS